MARWHQFDLDAPLGLEPNEKYLLWISHAGPLRQERAARLEVTMINDLGGDVSQEAIWDPEADDSPNAWLYTRPVPMTIGEARRSMGHEQQTVSLSRMALVGVISRSLGLVLIGLLMYSWWILIQLIPSAWNLWLTLGVAALMAGAVFGALMVVAPVVEPVLERVFWAREAWDAYGTVLTGAELNAVIKAGPKEGSLLASQIVGELTIL